MRKYFETGAGIATWVCILTAPAIVSIPTVIIVFGAMYFIHKEEGAISHE